MKLNMNRRMARVIIKIAGVEEGLGSVTSLIVNSQYAAISPVNVEGPVKSITPYAMDNDTYAALVIPGEGSNTETFVEVGTTTGGTRKIAGIKPAEAGKSYTYDLYVGERGATVRSDCGRLDRGYVAGNFDCNGSKKIGTYRLESDW